MGHLTAYGKPVDWEDFILGAYESWNFVGLWGAWWGKEVHEGSFKSEYGWWPQRLHVSFGGHSWEYWGPAFGTLVLARASGQCSGTWGGLGGPFLHFSCDGTSLTLLTEALHWWAETSQWDNNHEGPCRNVII